MNEPRSIFTAHYSFGATSCRPVSSDPQSREPPSTSSGPPRLPLTISTSPDETADRPWLAKLATDQQPLPAPTTISPKAPAPPGKGPKQSPKTPAAAGQKRSILDAGFTRVPLHHSEPLSKRRRLQTIYHRHTLDQFSFPLSIGADQPPSPLFFSHRQKIRPQLPPRFSSSEAAARMLSNAKGEESTIKTVKLARGTFSGSSPPGPTSAPGGPGLSDRSSIPRTVSSDGADRHDALQTLGHIGIIELLEQDGRPTFIVDLRDTSNCNPGPLSIVYANSALCSQAGYLELVTGKSIDESPGPTVVKSFNHFKAWLLTAVMHGESLDVCLPSFMHGGISWSCSTLRKRLRIVSASLESIAPQPPSANVSTASAAVTTSSSDAQAGGNTDPSRPTGTSEESEPQDYFGDAAPPALEPTAAYIESVHASAVEPPDPNKPTHIGFNGRVFARNSDLPSLDAHPSLTNECVLRAASAGDVDPFSNFDSSDSIPRETGFFDWTRLPITDSLPRHIRFARSVDWTSTALGPIEFWSSDLRQMCNLIMASPHPAAMYWGDELVAIYNEAYVLLAGQKHPTLMGQSYKDAWAEIWDEVKDVFANAKATGQATMKVCHCFVR